GRGAKNEFREIWAVRGRWTAERANALAARLGGRICRTGPSNGADGRCAGRANGWEVVNGIRVLRALCGTKMRGGDTGGAAMCGEMSGAEKRGAERRGAKLGAEK